MKESIRVQIALSECRQKLNQLADDAPQKRETRASLATEYNALEGQLRDALIVENPDDKPVAGGEKRESPKSLGGPPWPSICSREWAALISSLGAIIGLTHLSKPAGIICGSHSFTMNPSVGNALSASKFGLGNRGMRGPTNDVESSNRRRSASCNSSLRDRTQLRPDFCDRRRMDAADTGRKPYYSRYGTPPYTEWHRVRRL